MFMEHPACLGHYANSLHELPSLPYTTTHEVSTGSAVSFIDKLGQLRKAH